MIEIINLSQFQITEYEIRKKIVLRNKKFDLQMGISQSNFHILQAKNLHPYKLQMLQNLSHFIFVTAFTTYMLTYDLPYILYR